MSTRKTIDKSKQIITLISEQDVKTYTPLSPNKVETSIIKYIHLAQIMRIKQSLGTTLYDKLVAQWIDKGFDRLALPVGDLLLLPGDVGYNDLDPLDETNYKDLYDMVYEPLIWWSYLAALPNIAIKVDESGVMLNDTDFSTNAGMVGLKKLQAEGEPIARYFTELLNDYICETFKDDKEVSEEAQHEGNPSLKIYTGRKPWHRRNKCCGNKNCNGC